MFFETGSIDPFQGLHDFIVVGSVLDELLLNLTEGGLVESSGCW